MALQCPEHKMDVIPMWERTQEVKSPMNEKILLRVLLIVTSKCPEFGCGYTIESDEHGVMIRDSKGNH